MSYELYVGPIPDHHFVCHRCDVPACFNPAHLFVGTQIDNVRDCIQKGRRGYLKKCKLTVDLAQRIRSSYERKEMTQTQLAHRYGVSQTLIWRVVRGLKYQNPGS